MRPVRYNVAASLDGYIAGPDGEYDWIPHDPSVDFAAIFARVDTVLLGRRSYELVRGGPEPVWPAGSRVYVFSRTLRADEHPGVTVVAEGAAGVVAGLRRESGTGEVWLFGGGALFASLLAAGQVDQVEVTVVPVLLGGGVPLLPSGAGRATLALVDSRVYASGMVGLRYAVPGAAEERELSGSPNWTTAPPAPPKADVRYVAECDRANAVRGPAFSDHISSVARCGARRVECDHEIARDCCPPPRADRAAACAGHSRDPLGG